MLGPIGAQQRAPVDRWIGRDTDELYLRLHRRLVDHRLDLGNALRMQRAFIRAVRLPNSDQPHNHCPVLVARADAIETSRHCVRH